MYLSAIAEFLVKQDVLPRTRQRRCEVS